MKNFYIFIFILFSITIALTEAYLRYIGLGDPIRYDSNYIYGYAPKENQKKQRFKNSYITINDAGLRSLNKWKNNSKEKLFLEINMLRLDYVDDKDIFSSLIYKKSEYFCGNAGVNDYSVINVVMRSKYDTRLYNGEIYIFTLAPGDFYRQYKDSKTAHFYLNSKKFILPSITEAISFVFTKYDLNKYISKKDDTSAYRHKTELIDYSISLLNSEITRLENLGKKVLLFYTVERDDKKSHKKINKYILDNLNKLNLEKFYNLENTLNKDIYFYDSVHYNKLGHKSSETILELL